MARGSRREFKTLSNTYSSIWYETLDGWIAGSEFLESKRTGVFDCVIVKSFLQKLQQHHTHGKVLVAKCILGCRRRKFVVPLVFRLWWEGIRFRLDCDRMFRAAFVRRPLVPARPRCFQSRQDFIVRGLLTVTLSTSSGESQQLPSRDQHLGRCGFIYKYILK